MTCSVCAGKGLIRLNWSDAPDEFALCLCAAGMAWRHTRNNGKPVPALWRVWCTQHQVDPACVFKVEDVLTAEELAERGLSVAPVRSAEAALLAIGRKR